MRRILFVLLCGLLLPAISSWAIPVNGTGTPAVQQVNPNLESSGNYDLDWDYVYNVNGSSGVAIDDHWILTARHVADDYLSFGSNNLIIDGNSYTAMDPIYNDDADLAMIRYDNAFPSHYNYTTSSSFNGSEVIMVGFGRNGVVSQTATSGWWTEQSGDSTDVLRWGTNTVDSLVTPSGYSYSMLKTTISGTNNTTPYETGVNIGDSGGGMFAYVGTEWTLIGINILRGGSPDYNTSYSVPVGNYDTWIDNIILTTPTPEPATLALLLLGSLTLLRKHRP